jgi:hypothetical protein
MPFEKVSYSLAEKQTKPYKSELAENQIEFGNLVCSLKNTLGGVQKYDEIYGPEIDDIVVEFELSKCIDQNFPICPHLSNVEASIDKMLFWVERSELDITVIPNLNKMRNIVINIQKLRSNIIRLKILYSRQPFNPNVEASSSCVD